MTNQKPHRRSDASRELAAASPGRSIAAGAAARLALTILSLCGFLISLYLTLEHFRNIVPPCYVSSGCESVITSRYAVIGGVPLALVGTLYFMIMFYLGVALLVGFPPRAKRAYEVLAYLGLLGAICLFLLQAIVLKAYCSYCLGTEAIIVLMWGMSFALTSSRKR